MSNYTEADVERWKDLLEGAIEKAEESVGMMGQTRFALTHMAAAALEGVKVPGLKADNAALEKALRSVLYVDCCGPVTGLGPRAHAAAFAVLDSSDRGAALLAELEDVRAAWHRETIRADTLQARVAELERRDRNWRTHAETVEQERDTAESERDAIRAQVAPMREALEWVERETHPEDGLTFERIHAKAAAALSTPPAETTPRAAPISDPEWARKAAALEDGCDVVVGPPTETTPGIDPVSGACSTCGAIHAPGMNTLCSAERTPAPERAECKP